jgi:hypothetical protein
MQCQEAAYQDGQEGTERLNDTPVGRKWTVLTLARRPSPPVQPAISTETHRRRWDQFGVPLCNARCQKTVGGGRSDHGTTEPGHSPRPSSESPRRLCQGIDSISRGDGNPPGKAQQRDVRGREWGSSQRSKCSWHARAGEIVNSRPAATTGQMICSSATSCAGTNSKSGLFSEQLASAGIADKDEEPARSVVETHA